MNMKVAVAQGRRRRSIGKWEGTNTKSDVLSCEGECRIPDKDYPGAIRYEPDKSLPLSLNIEWEANGLCD